MLYIGWIRSLSGESAHESHVDWTRAGWRLITQSGRELWRIVEQRSRDSEAAAAAGSGMFAN